MKILVVGKNNVIEWPQGVDSALRSLGHSTSLFLFNKKTLSYLFMRLLGKKKRLNFLANSLRQRIVDFKPDLIFFVSAFFVPPKLFDVLKEFPDIKKIGWVGDKFKEDKAPQANCLDVLFCTDYGYLNAAKDFKCKVVYAPLCAEIYPTPPQTKTLPPVFVGLLNAGRMEYLQACQTKCLLYVKNCPKGKLTQHEVYRYKVSHSKMLDLMSKSVCPINMAFSVNNISGLNFRVFETSAMGGLIAVNKDCSDISRCYHVGTEALVYQSPQDFSDLLADIVLNPKKYEKIAIAGYNRTLKEHTYQKRMQQILDIAFETKKIK